VVLPYAVTYGSYLGLWNVVLLWLALSPQGHVSPWPVLLSLVTDAMRTAAGGVALEVGSVDEMSEFREFPQQLMPFPPQGPDF